MAELEQQALHQAGGASEDATLLFCAVLVSAKFAFQGIRNMLLSLYALSAADFSLRDTSAN